MNYLEDDFLRFVKLLSQNLFITAKISISASCERWLITVLIITEDTEKLTDNKCQRNNLDLSMQLSEKWSALMLDWNTQCNSVRVKRHIFIEFCDN